MNRTPGILDDIQAERRRQEQLHGDRTAAHAGSMDDGVRLAILTEEVGEVAEHLCDEHADPASPGTRGWRERQQWKREELIQLAAVAVAWIEAIDEAMEGSDGTRADAPRAIRAEGAPSEGARLG